MLYSIKKSIVRSKQRMKTKRDEAHLRTLSIEQMKVFKLVKELAKNNRECIKFDPHSDEIILLLENMLITMKYEIVCVDLTNIKLPSTVFSMLVEFIYMEAHKDRRKLKYQYKKKLNNFLDNIIK
jgi:hypothetical protein